MKKTKEKIIQAIDDILCDICNSSCKFADSVKSARITTDGKCLDRKLSYEIDLCEKCLNKTLSTLRAWRRQSGLKVTASSDPLEGKKQILPAELLG